LTNSSNTHDGKTIAQIFMLKSENVEIKKSMFEFNTIILANMLTIRAEDIFLYDVSFRNNEMLLGIMLSIDQGMTRFHGTRLYFFSNLFTSTKLILIGLCS
jgi:hypothetical protein